MESIVRSRHAGTRSLGTEYKLFSVAKNLPRFVRRALKSLSWRDIDYVQAKVNLDLPFCRMVVMGSLQVSDILHLVAQN